MKVQVGNISLWQLCFVTPEKGFAVGEWGVILRTTDSGENWTQYFAGTTENLHAVHFITPEVGWIVGKDEQRLKTGNGGDSWIIEHGGNDYEYLQVYFYDENIGWILGTPGFWSGNPSVILYTDNNGGYPIPVELTSFTYNVNNRGQVEINWSTATETNNYGFEVQRLRNNLENPEWEVAGFVSGHGTTTEPQYYSFFDELVLPGKCKFRLRQIDYDGKFEYSNEIEVDIEIHQDFMLEQNYPNPFNPSTTIRYRVPGTGNLKLAVYNVVGEEVAELVNGTVEAGFYEVRFDASNLPSGLYIYELQSDNIIEVKKMMLMK